MAECGISIVLPVYNDQVNLYRILDELSANTPDNNWEVVVVDDGSPTPLQLSSTPPDNWKLFRNDVRQGAASARNTGVKQAKGEFIVLLSVFLKIPTDYISQISNFSKKHTFDVAQHLLIKEAGLTADHFQAFLVDQSGRIFETDGRLPVKNTQFAATVFKKAIFIEVGGFDENMDHYGGHELDLAYRLDQKGFSTRVFIENLPLERIKLESHESVRTRLQEYGRIGLPALLKKHPELKSTILPYTAFWTVLRLFSLPKLIEKMIDRHVEQDRALTNKKYRLYLHLIVRNAWDAR